MAALWFVFAIGAAICWGLNYTVTEKILQSGVSMFFLMFINAFVLINFSLCFALLGKNNLIKNSLDLIHSGKTELWMVIAYVSSAFLGWCFVNFAIQLKNATSVSFVELSYPMFVIFFTWFFFRDIHLNTATILGALLIITGSLVLLWKG